MAYCERCERYFATPRALWQHEDNSSAHHKCDECDRDFTSWYGLKEHYVQSPRHFYCQSCDEHYDSRHGLFDHYQEDHHFCSSCEKFFKNETGLHEHNRQTHWYCESCRRVFQNNSNLESHLNSSVHKPRNFICPGANCGRGFVSFSALLLHFEAGTCPSGVTRAEVNRRAVKMDRKNIFTNPSRLISGPDGYTPAKTTETLATNRSWNGMRNAYECFLCHGLFSTLKALNLHLRSPRHQDRIYRCPNLETCGLEFSVMSALTQHVESGKCGVKRFKEMQDAINSLVGGVRRIAL